MAIQLFYCYDAYCNWCFGFTPIIKRLKAAFTGQLEFEVLSGGMILPKNPVHISVMSKFFLETSMEVESKTGIKFGNDYLWHIKNPQDSDWFPNSEKPAVALCIFKEYYPELQIEFASSLQFGLHVEGRDLCDDESYRHLLNEFNIPEDDFYNKLHEKEYRQKAYDEFALVKQLKVTGYPSVLFQITESKFQIIANGYTDYDTIAFRINAIINELNQ